ncbi:ParA family protein [Pseudoroseomonas ludipueritiae]|uniref:ParA family protein n=1 Tax=Pseudoroseomonas ludipueritiae TaxID=198093 RepID=A0ABR7R7W9_9PROT|nr:ParA family protein [Pseudoroseomonas ludipueritiae]MBC9177826.1 ParA family protein [Pseudoroseomonas ludipueritiae]MCG7363169.1 ParA family protein [Roseomonas sp. ACRSG]
MYITVASYKGGVGKTTTAVHLAEYLQTLAPTLLIDGDPNRSSTAWAKRGGFAFEVVPVEAGAYKARSFTHVVVDTEARPGSADFEALAQGCDLLVIPTVPATLETDVLVDTLRAAKELAPGKHRVLLVKVPPAPETDGQQLRQVLTAQGIPVFTGQVPRLKVFEHAASNGVSVRGVPKEKGSTRAWEAYEAIGKECIA